MISAFSGKRKGWIIPGQPRTVKQAATGSHSSQHRSTGLVLGKSRHLDAEGILQDEPDENLRDTVSVTRERFSAMMKALAEVPGSAD